MRTGTTLLTSILSSDPSTNTMIAEVQYLAQMLGSYRWGKNYFAEFLSDTFETPDDFKQFNRQYVGDYLKRTRDRFSPCEHLVLKTPRMTRLFPEVFELIDNVRFVVIIRDPRDTITSMMEVARKQRDAGQRIILDISRMDLKSMIIDYRSSYEWLFRNDLTDLKRATMLLRYEDLVLNFSDTVGKISQFTDLRLTDFDPNANWQRTTIDYEQVRNNPILAPWGTEVWGKPVSSERIGRFRARLTHDQVAFIEYECANLLRHFGYQATTGPP